jgi:hypothetical protein
LKVVVRCRQVVKIELKRRLKPLKVDELIDQDHPLFIGKILGHETRQKHYEVRNRMQYIEKHLEPPLVSSNYQSICGGCRTLCSSGCTGRRRKERTEGLPYSHLMRIRCGLRRLRQEGGRIRGWPVMIEQC